MKPTEFYERLQEVTEASTITLSPGPLVLRVNTCDAMAARLIEWLTEQMPEDATLGDFYDVLAAAGWWTTFFSALENGEQDEEEPAGD